MFAGAGRAEATPIDGVNPPAAGRRGELERVLDTEIEESFEVDRARHFVHHPRVGLEGFVVGVVAPDRAQLGEGADDLADVALETVRRDLGTVVGGGVARRVAAGDGVEGAGEVGGSPLATQPRVSFLSGFVEPAQYRRFGDSRRRHLPRGVRRARWCRRPSEVDPVEIDLFLVGGAILVAIHSRAPTGNRYGTRTHPDTSCACVRRAASGTPR